MGANPLPISMANTEDKAPSKENKSSWKDSIYNPRTGELMGRTASSWGKDPYSRALPRGFPLCVDVCVRGEGGS